MLRTMMVEEALRGRGIGRRLLLEFQEFLQRGGIRGTYCLARVHLDGFYGEIGFAVTTDIPPFLAERIVRYGGRNLCMKRP
jgi:GNAT superfamily N-acetyltransferase